MLKKIDLRPSVDFETTTEQFKKIKFRAIEKCFYFVLRGKKVRSKETHRLKGSYQ